MAGEWRNAALEDVAAEVTVGHVGPMASEYVERGIPFLRSQNVEPMRINEADLKFISSEFHGRLKKSALSPGDVVIVRTGKPGACAVIPRTLPVANCSDLVVVRCGPELDSRFLAYYVNSVAVHHVNSHLVGAVQQHFNVGSARTMIMRLPDLSEQRAIAHILGTLDDKIELNMRMSETLEAKARALFRSWFVDFDPVRAKAEGRDPGLPKPLADLFPSRLVESELGEIPEGWPACSLSETLHQSNERVGDKQVPEYSSTNDGIQPRSDRFTKRLASSDEKNKIIRHGYMVFGLSRQVLNFGLMRDQVGSVSAAYRVFVIDERKIEPEFLERMMRLRHDYFYLAVSASSREGQSVSVESLGHLRFVQPSAGVRRAWYRVTAGLRARSQAAQAESKTLAAMRDALLPRLISGELRVKDAGRFVAKAAS